MENSKKSSGFKPKRKLTKSVVLWTVALLLTLFSAVFQRLTGPTHPIKGSVEIAGEKIKYMLIRSHSGAGDGSMEFKATPAVGGSIYYKRFKTLDIFNEDRMEYHSGKLFGRLPHQPPAGKLEYYVVFRSGGSEVQIPPGKTAVIRFTGAVPFFPMALHIVLMFAAMLISMRALFEAIFPSGELKVYSFASLAAIFAGGLIFGPIVQKYAFGAYWTGIPLGWDLTNNKTLIAFLGWGAACYVVSYWKSATDSKRRLAVIAASLLTAIIFLIPHSMLGSELDYSKVDSGIPASHAIGQG